VTKAEEILTVLDWSGPSFISVVVRGSPDHPCVQEILEGSVGVGRPLRRVSFSGLEDARAYAREVSESPFDVWVDFLIEDTEEEVVAFRELMNLRGQCGVSPTRYRALFVSVDPRQWAIFRQVAGDLTSCASVFHFPGSEPYVCGA
jgi:hypothetical protein